MISESIQFHIQGELRTILLVSEWLIVAFALEYAFLFWLRARTNKKERLKSLQEKAYVYLFLAYGLCYVFYIIADYYVDVSLRMVFYSIAYLIIMGGALIFINIIERYKTFFKKYLFTYIFLAMLLFYIFFICCAVDFARDYTIVFYPLFFLFFLFYIRALFIDVYRKRQIKGIKKDVITIAMGFLFLAIGYNIATDLVVNIFGQAIRAIGNIMQLIAFTLIFLFLVSSPSFAEFDWEEKIDSIYITNNAGLFIYERNFRENRDPTDQNVIAGLLTGVKVMVQKLTHREGISIIEKKGKIIIIHPKELITGIIICDAPLKSLKMLLNLLLERVEETYTHILRNWNGNLNIFNPIDNITKEIFF